MTARILVVDDDECLRELMHLHLSGAGYQVQVAEDAIVAGHLLLEERVDLLVTDIEMPFMDGPGPGQGDPKRSRNRFASGGICNLSARARRRSRRAWRDVPAKTVARR